jgi:hypothetical protein
VTTEQDGIAIYRTETSPYGLAHTGHCRSPAGHYAGDVGAVLQALATLALFLGLVVAFIAIGIRLLS